MKHRNKLKTISIFLIVFSASIVSASDDSLKSLMVNLGGWEAEKPEVVKVEAMGIKSVTVTREYENGKKALSAAITAGSGSIMAGTDNLAAMAGNLSVETDDSTSKITTINGFKVTISFDKDGNEGQIVVMIKSGVIFALSFENISSDEALKLAQKFDWTKMKDSFES